MLRLHMQLFNVYVCLYVCMCVCMYVCMNVCMYIYIYIHMDVYVHVCVPSCMCACVCMYTYVFKHTHTHMCQLIASHLRETQPFISHLQQHSCTLFMCLCICGHVSLYTSVTHECTKSRRQAADDAAPAQASKHSRTFPLMDARYISTCSQACKFFHIKT